MDRISETLDLLRKAAATTDAITVAFSGGKDSLIVLDLCCRTFKRVTAFHMYLVPGLRCIEERLAMAEARWGITVQQYPHWVLHKCIVNGTFCFNHYRHDDLPEYKLADIYLLASADANTPLEATGAKRVDSLWRRRMLKGWGNRADVLYPIIGWSTFDVMAYLKAKNIPLPEESGYANSGLDLTTPELLRLYDLYPDDFVKVEAVFPFVRAVVERRRMYGIGSYKGMHNGQGR